MKGLLYSILAAMMIVPLLGLIFYHSMIGQGEIDITIRADELRYFVDSVGDDLVRFVDITGKRSMISAVSNVTVSGSPLDDAQARLAELMENGTINGAYSPLVGTDNLNTWKAKMISIASNSGFDMTIGKLEINVTQTDSFNVFFEIKTQVNISDRNLKMGVMRNVSATRSVSLDGIEDPLLPLNTIGRVSRPIRYYNFSNYTRALAQGIIALGSISGNSTNSTSSPSSQKILVTNNMSQPVATLNSFGGIVSETTYVPAGLSVPYVAGAPGALSIESGRMVYLDQTTRKVWDLDNLTMFVKGYYYKPSTTGPSFLDRLEGRLSLSAKYQFGMETLLNLQDMSLTGLAVNYGYSCVDYRYFGNVTGVSIRNGNYDPIFSWLKIDAANKEAYDLSELA
jgi:hypothetical protein